MNAALAIFLRELRIGARRPAVWAFGLAFFLLFLMLSALVLGPDPARLRAAAPAIVWLAAVFSILLSVQTLFSEPIEDGEQDWLMTQPVSLSAIIAARLIARWLLTAAPLVILAPAAAIAFAHDSGGLIALSLLLGSPAALGYAAAGAAAGAGAKGAGGILGPLIAGPLIAPVLIFGVGMAQSGAMFGPEARALLAASLFAAAICPAACALALRAQTD